MQAIVGLDFSEDCELSGKSIIHMTKRSRRSRHVHNCRSMRALPYQKMASQTNRQADSNTFIYIAVSKVRLVIGRRLLLRERG